MAKRSPPYSKEEKEFIKKWAQELGRENSRRLPWSKLKKEIGIELGSHRTAGALRAQYYRLISSDGEGATASQNKTAERYRRSTERFLAYIAKELGRKALLQKRVGELESELTRLRKEARPALITYQSILRAQKRVEGRVVVHSQD